MGLCKHQVISAPPSNFYDSDIKPSKELHWASLPQYQPEKDPGTLQTNPSEDRALSPKLPSLDNANNSNLTYILLPVFYRESFCES